MKLRLIYEFDVYGRPAPQGSKRHIGRGVMVESSKHVKPWRTDVKEAALAAAPPTELEVLDGPLVVDMVFTTTRPKSHYGSGRNATVLRSDAPPRPISAPDLSKLARSTEDALTGVLWLDDSRVTEYRRLLKTYAGEDRDALDRPGARIRIFTITQGETE